MQKIFMGGFIQWHMVVLCIWCALFVTSQFDVIFMFSHQRFAKFVDRKCIFSTHAPLTLCHSTKYKQSGLQVRKKTNTMEENKHTRKKTNTTLRHSQGWWR